jgi:hypothetical protein
MAGIISFDYAETTMHGQDCTKFPFLVSDIQYASIKDFCDGSVVSAPNWKNRNMQDGGQSTKTELFQVIWRLLPQEFEMLKCWYC